MNLPKIHKNFLSKETCQKFVHYIEQNDLWENNGDGDWNSRSINLFSMNEEIREEMLDVRIQVKKTIQEDFNFTQDIYADIFQFVRWLEGNALYPHADAENPDGSPHPFPYRNFAAVLYLNDNYDGGQIYFPTLDNFRPEIEVGTLAIFPGTVEYLHGVTKITSGTRYTIAGFFTYDSKYRDSYRL